MIRTVYLAGPITQDPDYLRKFASAAASLRADGFDVIDPCEIDDPKHAAEALLEPYGERYEELLARDLKIIGRDEVEAVVVLPGWTESRGAWREVDHAVSLDKPVLEYPNLNPAPVYEARCGRPRPRPPSQVPICDTSPGAVRTFDTGATRDTDEGKPDYEAYLSPRVLRAYGAYMLRHSLQADGSRRAGDNWQKGIPLDAYAKSEWRHHMDFWEAHRDDDPSPKRNDTLEEALCALIFNASGYLHELLRDN